VGRNSPDEPERYRASVVDREALEESIEKVVWAYDEE
jgi:hypothetical protein